MTHCSFSAEPVIIKWQEEQEQKASVCFNVWNQVSSSSCWMLRECVLIVLHNSVLSCPAGLWPRLPTPATVRWCGASKQCRAAVLLHGATVGQSPRGGVFSNRPVPNLVSDLNCVFVISSLWMSVCLHCGSMDSCFWIPRMAFISAVIVVPLSHHSGSTTLQHFSVSIRCDLF